MTISADRVGHVVVIQFADACRKVTRQSKGLRQADLGGHRLAENLTVGDDATAVRIKACQHRVPARTTQGKGAVGALKLDATSRELVDIGRLRPWVAIAAEVVIQVIGDEK